MKNKIGQTFLLLHGMLLLVIGVGAAIATTIGRTQGYGPFSFLQNNNIASIGLFEAYLLASVCGFCLILGSREAKYKKWHFMGAIIHVPLLFTNIIYRDFYKQVHLEMTGDISTIFHALLITVELFLLFKENN